VCKTFDDFSLNRPEISLAAPKFKSLASIATINLPMQFELSISTYYEDMNSDTKYQKWGGLG